MPRCLTRISLVLLLFISSEVWALGLGEVRLESALNEPLRARIELFAASPEEVQNLKVALASPATFERYGLERPYYLQNMVFDVVRTGRADGNYVSVRTQSPMTEPFLTFLVEATWANGRLLREYTVLLDPPTFAPQSETPAQPQVTAPQRSAPADSGTIERRPPPAAAQQPAATPAPERAAPAAAQPPVTRSEPPAAQPPAAQPAPAVADAPFDATAGDELTVTRGETLWGIADRVRPDSRLSMNQTMLAIFEANPEAFGGNINILRAGARLRIPSAEAIRRIDRNSAFNEARRQNAEWSGGEVEPPASAAAPEPAPETETRPSLTLVPPDEDADTGEETGLAGETPVPADEPALSREQEIVDRIAALEAADVPEQASLIEIRNDELANLRRELAEIRGEVYEPTADTTDEPFVDEESAADETAPEPAEGELFPDFGDEEAETPAVAGDDTAASAPQPDTTTQIRRAEPEPSLVSTLLGWLTNVWVLLGVALLAVIAILVWFMRRGSGGDDADAWTARRAPDVDLDETMTATESLRAPSRDEESIVVIEQTGRFRKSKDDTIEAEAPRAKADATGTFGSLEDTFSSETAVNLDQSDPLAEADFHMAYGLYDQAADLINGALQSEPERQDLLTKLCEIYFVWGNRESFVEAAARLQSASGGASDDWDKIVIMGQQIAADEAMFAGGAGATRRVDLSFDEDDAGATGALDMDFDAEDGGDDDVIDLGAGDGGDDDIFDLGDGDDEDMIDLGGTDDGEEVIDLGAADNDGIDFVFDDATGTQKTVEMPAADRTSETPTIEEQFSGLDATGKQRTHQDSTAATGRNPQPADATAEIDLDDLGLDLEAMEATELASLDDDDATELASLDDLDATGTNEGVSEPEPTGKFPEMTPDDTGLMGGLDLDDDEFSSTRTGMRLAPDETGVHPAHSAAEETDSGLDVDDDLLAATGRTQVLPEDFAVETFTDDGEGTLGDDDKTLLASSLREEDFDFAKTEALPPGTYPGDDEATGEMPALGSTDMDLDLDDLTEALKQSEQGDTVEQPRDDATVEQPRTDATVEHRRPDLDDDDDTAQTLSFSPDDLSDELDEARTMTEVGTKLDLARAYVDMGDPAGARSILEEVLDEGDTGQRQQAQKLLDSLPG